MRLLSDTCGVHVHCLLCHYHLLPEVFLTHIDRKIHIETTLDRIKISPRKIDI